MRNMSRLTFTLALPNIVMALVLQLKEVLCVWRRKGTSTGTRQIMHVFSKSDEYFTSMTNFRT